MGMPTVPDVTPPADFDKEQVALLVITSIAFEELALAHIINAEGEKIQSVLGTLDRNGTGPLGGEQSPPAEFEPPSLDELLEVNKSVRKTLETVMMKEALLNIKFEKALDLLDCVTENGGTQSEPVANP